jgi:hypothetical protein
MLRSSIDWILFSASDVRNASRIFEDKDGGVRDELGFLAVHQVFSDYFFPGTSTQQTRLRYVFFVPWALEQIATDRKPKSVREQLPRAEQVLTKNLVTSHEKQLGTSGQKGIIGARSINQLAVTPPSISYWTTLRRWGICHRPRAELLDEIQSELRTRKSQLKLDDDGDRLIDELNRFDKRLPSCPDKRFHTSINTTVDFQLLTNEQEFIYEKVVALPPVHLGASVPDQICLFGKLASHLQDHPGDAVYLDEVENCWDLVRSPHFRGILNSDDKQQLNASRRFSALVYIGRALYWATLQTMREQDLKKRSKESDVQTEHSRDHVEHLTSVLSEYRQDALRVDLADGLGGQLLGTRSQIALRRVLEATLKWLQKNDSKTLFTTGWHSEFDRIFEKAEWNRKGPKSKLTYEPNRRGGAVFGAPLAYPLGYRWNIAKRFLCDLAGYDSDAGSIGG